MAGARQPIKFYPEAWLADAVSHCSLAAQGLWLRMLFLMWTSNKRGYLVLDGAPMPPPAIAKRCGTTVDEYNALLTELDTAGVPRRTPENIIFNKRMVTDDAHYRKSVKTGRLGGNPLLLMGGDNPPDNGVPTPGSSRFISWSSASGFGEITGVDKNDWARAFPACNIERQLSQMHAWLAANPAKARKSNWRRFIVNWLTRSQDRGGDNGVGNRPEVKHDNSGIVAHLRAKEAKCAPKK